jgi:hypothetical protein
MLSPMDLNCFALDYVSKSQSCYSHISHMNIVTISGMRLWCKNPYEVIERDVDVCGAISH